MFCSSFTLIHIQLLSLSIIYLIAYLLIASLYLAEMYVRMFVCAHLFLSLHENVRSVSKFFNGNVLKSNNILHLDGIASFMEPTRVNVTTLVKE